ncbi:unnamed protein product [Heligmosomoides polygyrus]|uniref:Uncharacterized protein n=1 Tax=Heligmosomoides polygyrus TaxID=6339 RepID=A0A183GNH6_HELPZ|nr:unnamed protein product [Heligmosomoides polygyrus]
MKQSSVSTYGAECWPMTECLVVGGTLLGRVRDESMRERCNSENRQATRSSLYYCYVLRANEDTVCLGECVPYTIPPAAHFPPYAVRPIRTSLWDAKTAAQFADSLTGLTPKPDNLRGGDSDA